MRAIPPGRAYDRQDWQQNQRCVKANKECSRSADTGQDESLSPRAVRHPRKKAAATGSRRLLDA